MTFFVPKSFLTGAIVGNAVNATICMISGLAICLWLKDARTLSPGEMLDKFKRCLNLPVNFPIEFVVLGVKVMIAFRRTLSPIPM